MGKTRSKRLPYLATFVRENGERHQRSQLFNYAEDRAALLNYSQKRIDLPASVKSTFLMVFSPDGQRVASTHGDHKIYISELKTGRVVQTLEGHPRTPWCLAFHPTLKNMVASGCLAGEVRVWDLHSGACEVWVNSHGSVIASLAFHPTDHVILIATCNELHFWDWRQSNTPYLSLMTSSEKEKVRYVKFDRLGSKIITGISNMPTRSATSLLDRQIMRNSLDNLSDSDAISSLPASSLAARRSNLLSRVMSMYRTLDNIDPNTAQDAQSSTQAQPTAVSLTAAAASATASSLASSEPLAGIEERTWDRIQQNPSSTSTGPISWRPMSPSMTSRYEQAREYAARLSFELTGSETLATAQRPLPSSSLAASPLSSLDLPSQPSSSAAGAPPPPSFLSSIDPHSNSLMSTFRRLHSLCARLAQLMQEQQQSPRANERSRDIRSTEASTSLNDLLSRLQQSLQTMSTAAMTTAIAQEHIQQVRQRVAEILERLVNVSGYRARLSNLRDQIYEVAERIAAGSEPELGGTHRWDLMHCLWLVDMSIHLTRQMQRILAADYRLTQLTLSSNTPPSTSSNVSTIASANATAEVVPSSNSSVGSSSSTTSNSATLDADSNISSASNSSMSSLESDHVPVAGPSRGRPSFLRSDTNPIPRYHPYSRWLIRNRTTSASSGNQTSPSVQAMAETQATFSIPVVRVSSVADEENNDHDVDMSPDNSSDGYDLPRPRTPPLVEIQEVLQSRNRPNPFPRRRDLDNDRQPPTERYNVSGLRAPGGGGGPGQQPFHLWFPSAANAWPIHGSINHELNLFQSPVHLTYRVQCWDFSKFNLPNLKDCRFFVIHVLI